MKSLRRSLIAGLGLTLAGWAAVQPAAAQYYGGPDYGGYDRPGRYERRDSYERRGYGRDDWGRRDERGWRDERAGRPGYDDRRGGYGRRAPDPMAGMGLDERKRAIKNEREAQKKIFKQQQFQRNLLGQ
jgi:hypothetical protein